MPESAAYIHHLLRQQTALARFGSFALGEPDLMKVLNEAAKACAAGLDVPFCKVCQYRAETNDLLVIAGFGWKPGVVGHVVSRADGSTPQGRAFSTGLPSVCSDLRADNEFVLPAFYAEHNVVSTIDVIIKGKSHPYGVLEIDNDHRHDYDQQDIDFLTGFANVMAEAVATSERVTVLRNTIAQLHELAAEKDRLIEQKNMLAAELQHRVRNNLQLIHGMLRRQVDDTIDDQGRKGIESIARRVFTLSQVYDLLLGTQLARSVDFGSYLAALCDNLAEIHAAGRGTITLGCETDAVILDLDVITALGLVVAELVNNGYQHAFPDGHGAMRVALHIAPGDAHRAVMTISDNGTGFVVGAESKRHGIGLVRRLVCQVKGVIEMSSVHGTTWTISFPTTPEGAAAGLA